MKRTSLVYAVVLTFLFSSQVMAVCMTRSQGKIHGCERYNQGDAWCIGKYGSDYVGFKTTNRCTKSLARKLRKSDPDSELVSDLSSLLDEIESTLELASPSNAGLSMLTSQNEFSNHFELKDFDDKRVQDLVKKMEEASDLIHTVSISNIPVNSGEGKKIIALSGQYIQLTQRIFQAYAQTAHKSFSYFRKYSFDTLDKLEPKMGKKYALELLARNNYKAYHIDKETLKFKISEVEKQDFELMAIEKPHDVPDYAKLVQFLAIKEGVTNQWAVQRLTSKKINDPAVNMCGKNFLSFRPKEDGSVVYGKKAKRMSKSDAYQELFHYDLFYNDLVPKLPELVEETKKHNLLDMTASLDLTKKIMKIPTIEYTLIEEFGYDEMEIDEWAYEIAEVVYQNEREEWKNFAEAIIFVSNFPGDKLDTESLANRMAEDTYDIHYKTVTHQYLTIFEELPAEDVNLVHKYIKEVLDSQKVKWASYLKSQLKKIISPIHYKKTVTTKNYTEKVQEVTDAAISALPGAHFIKGLNEAIEKEKYDPEKLTTYSKMDTNLLDPKSPHELLIFLQAKLATHYSGKRISSTMDADQEYSAIVQNFLKDLSDQYAEKVKIEDSDVKKAKKLYDIAYNLAKKLKKDYPIDQKRREKERLEMQKQREEFNRLYPITYPTVQQDNTYVAPSYVNTYVIDNQFKYEPINNQNNATDNTTSTTNNSVNLQDPKLFTKFDDPNLKTATDSTGNNFNQYDVYSMMKISPVVADNTRVAINDRMLAIKDCLDEGEGNDYNPMTTSYKYKDKGDFVEAFTRVLSIDKYNTKKGKLAKGSFLSNLNDQKIMAEHYVADAYSGSPMLKIKLTRYDKHVYKSTYYGPGGGGGYWTWESTEKEALMRMVTAGKDKHGTVKSAITFPSYNTAKIDKAKVTKMVKEIIETAQTNVSGQMKVFCEADFSNYKKDKNYKTLFKSVTGIRDSLKSDQSLNPCEAKKIADLDDQLRKDTRFFHERINEDFIEPMLWVAAAVFIIGTIVLTWLGSAGTLAPATVALLMMIIDVVDIAVTASSLYFKGAANFYEIPAQIKFQKSLAMSQIDDPIFTTFADVEVAEQQNRMGKMMMGIEALLAPVVGAQFSASYKRFVGITGKRAMQRFGMPVRHFGQPPKSAIIKRNLKDLRKKYGYVGALTRKTKDMVMNAKKWLPRYQPYSADELSESVRVGLVKSAKDNGLATEPWKLTKDIDNMVGKIDERLVKNGEFIDEFGKAHNTYKLEGNLIFKEVMKKPFYSKGLFVPKTFMKALFKGNLGSYLKKYGDTMEALNRLRQRFINNRKKTLLTIKDKLDEVKKLATRDPEKLTKNHQNAFDYFQSLLTKEEIKFLSDIAKYEKNLLKTMSGSAYKGHAHVFTKVFKDYNRIMETIEPLTSTTGVVFRATKYYKNPLIQTTKEMLDESDDIAIDASLKAEDDIINFYESMLKNEGGKSYEDELSIIERQFIESENY